MSELRDQLIEKLVSSSDPDELQLTVAKLEAYDAAIDRAEPSVNRGADFKPPF